MHFEATEVFEDNWNAMHQRAENGKRLYRYIINEGSSRSSKTYSLIDCLDLYCRENTGKRVTIWRDTKRLCKDTVLKDARKHLAITGRWCKGHRYHATESVLTYDTNTLLEIHGTDDAENVHGLTQDVAWFNEPYKISKDTFDQIDQRTAEFIFIDWNPKMAHWIEDLKKDPRTIVIKSTFLKNPFCPYESRIKLLSYKPLSHAAAVLKGLKTEDQLRAGDTKGLSDSDFEDAILCLENERKGSADAYNWSVYGLGEKAERPDRIFRWTAIEPFEYDAIPATTLVYGNDWGIVDPWGVVEVKYFDGGLYLRQKNYLSENELRSKMPINDLAALQHDPEGLVKRQFNLMGISPKAVIACDTNRPQKTKALRVAGYDYAIAAPKGLIVDGINLLLDMPVYYCSSSKDLHNEQENYSWKKDRYGIRLEEPEDIDNHLIDAVRYAAQYLRAVGVITKA